MRGAHTPSPWLWSGDELIGSNGKRVIETIPYEGMWIDPEGDDARLIAAAPDLLEALEAISKRASQLFEGSEKLRANDARAVRRMAELAEAAIAKATTTVEPNSVGTPQGVNPK